MQNQSRPGSTSPSQATSGSSGAGGSSAGGPSAGARPGGPQAGSPQAGSSQDELRRDAEQVAEEVRQVAANAKNVAGSVKDEVVSVAADMRDQAAAMAEPLQQKGRSLAEEQKQAGAQRVRGVARAISSAADDLDDEMPQAAAWIRRGASQLETISQSVRDKSVEDLARDTERFARNNTAAFFGLSLVAGFALARFLKSGAPETTGHAGTTAS
ncbi:hypothetical protein CH338_02185, partial [Rhodoplanes elegans]